LPSAKLDLEAINKKYVKGLETVWPMPKHTIKMFYSETCSHCARVLPLLQEFERQHPEVSVELIEATTERQTKHLAAILGGKKPEVPTAVIDGKYLVVGETNFIERISFALKLAEKTPPLQEEKSRWLLRT